MGGCDGCINVDYAPNAGLRNIVESLEILYDDDTQGISGIMSRADFWQLAAISVIEEAIEIANKECDDGE